MNISMNTQVSPSKFKPVPEAKSSTNIGAKTVSTTIAPQPSTAKSEVIQQDSGL